MGGGPKEAMAVMVMKRPNDIAMGTTFSVILSDGGSPSEVTKNYKEYRTHFPFTGVGVLTLKKVYYIDK